MRTHHFRTTWGAWLYSSIVILWCAPASSDQKPLIEEIFVTAQRIEENAQDVPIAVSAFTDPELTDRQIILLSDLQLNVPNFSYVPDNFASARPTIRGIGAITNGGDRGAAGPAVPIHTNGIISPVDVSVLEFYDVERVEVSRGPQGTLYGQTSTAGAINVVTRRPAFDGHGGFVDLEYGDYDHTRIKGAANLVLGERFALRAAGLFLQRDGYTENLASSQIAGVDDDLDDRDFHSYRITAEWRPTDSLNGWLIFTRFDEEDSRTRITNQVCKQSVLANLGCEPNQFGLDPVNPFNTLNARIAGQLGIVDFSTLQYAFPRPRLNLREQHTDFTPVFKLEEDAWLLGIQWDLPRLTVDLSGGHFESSRLSQQDYRMDVGYRLNPTIGNPSGLWPTSAPSGPAGALRGGGPCDVESGRAGVAGGCILNVIDREFTIDQAAGESELWTAELRARSNLEGRFNFLVGTSFTRSDQLGEYYVLGNTLDTLLLLGAYPSFFNSGGEEEKENYSVFGEMYVNLTQRMRLTIGLRYNHDKLESKLATAFVNATNVAPPGEAPVWVRNEMLSFFGEPVSEAIAAADLYGATEAIAAATTPIELVEALKIVPIVQRYGEGNVQLGIPDNDEWSGVNGRFGLDWAVTDEAMLYGFFSQGYRPGGLNVNLGVAPSYDSETVNAFEFGAKSRWMRGSLLLNGAMFFNDHRDLQIVQSLGIGAVTENVDAKTYGMEIEAIWRPDFMPGLLLQGAYGWLETEIKNARLIDSLNRTANDSTLVNLRDADIGLGDGYVAPIAEVLPLVESAQELGEATFPAGGTYPNGIPVWFSRSFLTAQGVAVADAKPVDLDGAELPTAPNHSISLGIAHSWTTGLGVLTIRYDYYWQDSSYGREFNTQGDEIDDWDQHNASVILEDTAGRWQARAWIRNITDDEIVNAHYLTNDTSGNFRNYFLSEPRIYGISFRYNFGI